MITTIISYSSNEYRFIHACIKAAQLFSSEVIVSVCDHFFDETPENMEILETTYAQHPDIHFVQFAYDPIPYGIGRQYTKSDPNWKHYYHSTARWVAFHHRRQTDNYILFLDADEIVDSEKMKSYLLDGEYLAYSALRFKERFYFGSETLCGYPGICKNVLVNPKTIPDEALLDVDERRAIFLLAKGLKRIPEGVFIDHYSFVRTKAEMERKIASWGHGADYAWNVDVLHGGGRAVAEAIFNIPFHRTEKKHDFSLSSYSSREVNPHNNVTTVDRIQMLQKSI